MDDLTTKEIIGKILDEVVDDVLNMGYDNPPLDYARDYYIEKILKILEK